MPIRYTYKYINNINNNIIYIGFNYVNYKYGNNRELIIIIEYVRIPIEVSCSHSVCPYGEARIY